MKDILATLTSNMRYRFKVQRSQSGFTLIELIVVISIIGILSSVLVANFMQVRLKTRDGVRKSDLQQIRLALETYRVDVGEYPAALYTTTGCGQANSIANDSGTEYMSEIPCDPRDGNTQYIYEPNTTTYLQYSLYACAENENDPDAIPDPTDECSGGDWNDIVFEVTNP